MQSNLTATHTHTHSIMTVMNEGITARLLYYAANILNKLVTECMLMLINIVMK